MLLLIFKLLGTAVLAVVIGGAISALADATDPIEEIFYLVCCFGATLACLAMWSY